MHCKYITNHARETTATQTCEKQSWWRHILPEMLTGLLKDNGPLNAAMDACQEENKNSCQNTFNAQV